MKIVRVIGGLGNQMFQYTFYRNLIEKGHEAKLDLSGFDSYHLHNGYELDRIFDLEYEKADSEDIKGVGAASRGIIFKIKNRYFGKKIYLEKDVSYKQEVFEIEGDIYYNGYWQSEKYFDDIRGLVLEMFKFKTPLKGKNLEISKKIQNENSVSVHVRRGDYVEKFKTARVHGGICDQEYYIKAVSLIEEKISDPVYYIFSDDKEWVKKNIKLGDNCSYVDWNFDEDSYRDMQLMSMCRHNIIANSSFSWWAAWLNRNPDKIVIAPSKWFNNMDARDIIPEGWLKI